MSETTRFRAVAHLMVRASKDLELSTTLVSYARWVQGVPVVDAEAAFPPDPELETRMWAPGDDESYAAWNNLAADLQHLRDDARNGSLGCVVAELDRSDLGDGTTRRVDVVSFIPELAAPLTGDEFAGVALLESHVGSDGVRHPGREGFLVAWSNPTGDCDRVLRARIFSNEEEEASPTLRPTVTAAVREICDHLWNQVIAPEPDIELDWRDFTG